MIDIKWDHKYEVGHPRIDHEHQVFVDLIRSISLASPDEDAKDRTARVLIEVKKYAEFHFVSEENIMLDFEYPDYEKHKNEHQLLIGKLDYNLHRFLSHEITPEQIAEFMFEWFALHTSIEDKKIALFIQSKHGRA